MRECDVVVVGSGMGGSTLALILARQGVSVTLVERGTHPRFALGESILRPTALWLRVLAARYGVPELDVIASLSKIDRELGHTSGVKKGFGFLHHREGAERLERSWWGSIPASYELDVEEAHLFRQDIDSYLFHAAVAAGCEALSATSISAVETDPLGVTVSFTEGAPIRAAYIVDGSGGNSLIARSKGLRETPTRYQTRSRTLFTHMVGVRPYEELELAPTPCLGWSSGTLHHFFPGGWMWVIPFGNRRGSPNPLVSVGLNLDLRHFPPGPPASPEEEWAAVLARFPSIAKQFAEARPVRPWVATPRMQYSSSAFVAERACLLSHAGGSIDPLYSRGLMQTLQGINTTAALLLSGLAAGGDLSAERFQGLDAQQHALLEVNDLLVDGTYLAFEDPDLIDAWLAIWSLSEQLSLRFVLSPFARYLANRDLGELAFADSDPAQCMAHQGEFCQMLRAAHEAMRALSEGQITGAQARARLEEGLESVRALGFDPAAIRSVLGKLSFTSTVRRYFDLEDRLLEAIAALDSHGSAPLRLRTSPGLGYLVRVLGTQLARWSASAGRGADSPAPGSLGPELSRTDVASRVALSAEEF